MTTADHKGVIVQCPACGQQNRLAPATLGKPSRCGKCKTAVTAPAEPIEAPDSATFETLAASSGLPLIVDFWAPWCGPCRAVAPELQRVAREQQGRYLVVKVNTDQLTDVAARFRISSIPTLAIVYRGQELQRVAGVRPAREILAFAQSAVADFERRAS